MARRIYQNYSLYASRGLATGIHTGVNTPRQFTRIQTWEDSFTRNFTDITQYGNLAAIDRIEPEAPSVTASTSWFVTDGGNERTAGLTVSTGSDPLVSCISGILSKVSDEKNYFLLVVAEGSDASEYTGPTSGVLSIGNGTITSFSAEGAVGGIPTSSFSFEGFNWRVYADADGTENVPAINASGYQVSNIPFVLVEADTHAYAGQVSALQPGDIEVNYSNILGFVDAGLQIQSYNISFDLSRTPQQKLGRKYPVAREITFPINATLSLEFEFSNLEDGNLADLICETGTVDIDITLKNPSCDGTGTAALRYYLKGGKVATESISTSIGPNGTVSAEFTFPVGGPEDTDRGIFISGTYQ